MLQVQKALVLTFALGPKSLTCWDGYDEQCAHVRAVPSASGRECACAQEVDRGADERLAGDEFTLLIRAGGEVAISRE